MTASCLDSRFANSASLPTSPPKYAWGSGRVCTRRNNLSIAMFAFSLPKTVNSRKSSSDTSNLSALAGGQVVERRGEGSREVTGLSHVVGSPFVTRQRTSRKTVDTPLPTREGGEGAQQPGPWKGKRAPLSAIVFIHAGAFDFVCWRRLTYSNLPLGTTCITESPFCRRPFPEGKPCNKQDQLVFQNLGKRSERRKKRGTSR